MWSFRRSLRNALASEAKAYGFTLVIWGTGAFTIGANGFPTGLQVFAFVGGALTSMALVLLIAFGDLRQRWREDDPPRYAFGAIHLVSVFAALIIAAAVSAVPIPAGPSFFVVPFISVMTHQLVLATEIRLSLDMRDEREAE